MRTEPPLREPPPRRYDDRRPASSHDHERDRDRDRERSRDRAPRQDAPPHPRDRRGAPPPRRPGGRARGRGGAPPPPAERKNREYQSPQSFGEAWTNGFFSPSALMLVASIGIILESIPALSTLAIGGRLLHCVSAWKLICQNLWVINVVRFGYKIPFRSKPSQLRIPENPEVSQEAHEVLDLEAQGLLDKNAIRVVDHEPGEFLSSYFAVPKPRSSKFPPILNLKYFKKI